MASASPNTTVTATTFSGAQTLFSVAGGDAGCKVYTVHNRDTAVSVRVAVRLWQPGAPGAAGAWLVNGADGGAVIPPGQTIPFAAGAGQIGLVQVWTESGTPIIDGFVEA
jgi:hypothetical protein